MFRAFLKDQIQNQCKIPCFNPANGESLIIETNQSVPVGISREALKRKNDLEGFSVPFSGILINEDERISLLSPGEHCNYSGRKNGKFLVSTSHFIDSSQWDSVALPLELHENHQFTVKAVCSFLYQKLLLQFPDVKFEFDSELNVISFYSIKIQFNFHNEKSVRVDTEWEYYVSSLRLALIFRTLILLMPLFSIFRLIYKNSFPTHQIRLFELLHFVSVFQSLRSSWAFINIFFI